MSQVRDITIRQAKGMDLVGMAQVYLAAFPESVEHFFGGQQMRPEALADLLRFVLRAEPRAVRVADYEGRVVGYCLSPSRLSRISRLARRPAALLWWLRRWIAGRYHLPWRTLRLVVRNKLLAWFEGRNDPHECEARILSIAVHPDFQGLGVGKRLLLEGLDYLEKTEVPRVRLEVRPENDPARTLYEKQGFVAVGRTADSQGDWLIMIKEFAATHDR